MDYRAQLRYYVEASPELNGSNWQKVATDLFAFLVTYPTENCFFDLLHGWHTYQLSIRVAHPRFIFCLTYKIGLL